MKAIKLAYQSPRCEVHVLSPNADVLEGSIGIVKHSGGGGGFDEGDIL